MGGESNETEDEAVETKGELADGTDTTEGAG